VFGDAQPNSIFMSPILQSRGRALRQIVRSKMIAADAHRGRQMHGVAM
jgi:hypothetical protein